MSEKWEEGFWPPPEPAPMHEYQKEIERLRAENQRLKEYAQLVETAIEAEECNGTKDDHSTTITLHFSWFKRARKLLAEGDQQAGLPIKGVVKDEKIEWTGLGWG